MTTQWWNVESAFYAVTPVLVKQWGSLVVWLVAVIWLTVFAGMVSRHYAVFLARGHPVSAGTLLRAVSFSLQGEAVPRSRHRGCRRPGGFFVSGGLVLLPVLCGAGSAHALLPFAGLCVIGLAAAIDARTCYLPDSLTWPLLGLGLAHAWAGYAAAVTLEQAIAGALAGYALPWAVAFAYRCWRGRVGLGGGDIKLLAAIGAWVGAAQVAWVLLLACILALLWACFSALRQYGVCHAGDAGQARPFGPALAAAGVAVFMLQSALQCQFTVCFPAYLVQACTKLV